LRPIEAAFESDGVCGTPHRPDDPTGDAPILAHGAGPNAQAPPLARVARSLAARFRALLWYPGN
jgi:predicted alpha/beta-hydrolase family hydrolase